MHQVSSIKRKGMSPSYVILKRKFLLMKLERVSDNPAVIT